MSIVFPLIGLATITCAVVGLLCLEARARAVIITNRPQL